MVRNPVIAIVQMMIIYSNVEALGLPTKNIEPALKIFMHAAHHQRHIPNANPLRILDNITKQEREALKNLIDLTDVIIMPTDKGKDVLAMDN